MSGRVVYTGAGVITSIGAGVEAFEEALYSGNCGIAPSARFNGAAAGEIVDFTPVPWLGNKGIRVLDRAARLLCVAAQMSLTAAGRPADPAGEGDPESGLVCGTMFGGLHSIATFDHTGVTEGPSQVNPADFPNTVINSPTGHAGIKFKLRGVNSTICAGFASGLQAISYAADFVRFERAKWVLAGGLEELCEESSEGFQRTGLASPDGTVRPFGRDRNGTVPGEGAALWLLELEETARERGATPLGEVRGFGAAHDAASLHGLHASGAGAASAMRQAIASAGLTPADIACIFASANGSRLADEIEARAINEVLGPGAPPVCAPKAAWGEAMGAAGGLAAVAAGIALQRQMLPPTAGFAASDSGLKLSAQPQPISGDHALINSIGCDGANVSLLISLWREV